MKTKYGNSHKMHIVRSSDQPKKEKMWNNENYNGETFA